MSADFAPELPAADRLLITREELEASYQRHYRLRPGARADLADQLEAAAGKVAAELGLPREAFAVVEVAADGVTLLQRPPGIWPMSSPGQHPAIWAVLCPRVRA